MAAGGGDVDGVDPGAIGMRSVRSAAATAPTVRPGPSAPTRMAARSGSRPACQRVCAGRSARPLRVRAPPPPARRPGHQPEGVGPRVQTGERDVQDVAHRHPNRSAAERVGGLGVEQHRVDVEGPGVAEQRARGSRGRRGARRPPPAGAGERSAVGRAARAARRRRRRRGGARSPTVARWMAEVGDQHRVPSGRAGSRWSFCGDTSTERMVRPAGRGPRPEQALDDHRPAGAAVAPARPLSPR